MAQPRQNSERLDFWRGLGLTFLLHFAVLGIPAGLAFKFPTHVLFSSSAAPDFGFVGNLFILYMLVGGFGLWFIGVVQFLYMDPAIEFASRRQRPGIVRGLRFGRLLTALINGAVWAIIGCMNIFFPYG